MGVSMRNRRNEQGFLVIIVGVVLVIVAIVFTIGLFTSHSKNSASSSPSPSQSLIPKATTIAKMQAIYNQLSASWQVCQINPSKCQASVAQIGNTNDVFDGVSSQYNGKTLDDLTGWKQDTSLAKGDMKQWVVNAAFNKDNSLLSSTIPSEIQDSQTQIASFTSDT